MFPIFHQNLGGVPKTIIITAEHDPLRDQGEMYNLFLLETGIQAKGMIHGFLN